MEEMKHETGRAPLLSEDQEAQVIAFITSNFEGGSPVSPKQIRLSVSETFAIRVSSSWTWRFVVRHPETLQRAIAYPQEDKRMKVTKEIARTHIRNLERWVENLPTELILNLDEVGVQEWADRKKRKVIIPYQVQPRKIEYAVTRKEKRISCITTISMAGDALMPLLVIHRRTIDDAVWEEGWRDGQDFMIRSNSSSYVTREIFKEYLTQVLMPYVETTRQSLHLEQFAGALLCDNCASHVDDEIMSLLANHNIRLLTFPPHTSHLFQPLDLVTFAALKREKREIYSDKPEVTQVWQITKLMKALEHATDSANNRSAFKRAGLLINPRVYPAVALVDSRKLNEMVDSSTLPEILPLPEGQEPAQDALNRRPAAVFGFLNAHFFPDE
jgi:hypothetical protein